MKLSSLLFIITCLAFVYTSTVQAEHSNTDLYKVGSNDTISIEVLEHPDLKTLTIVSSDGTITFPYLGNVYVKGMSVSEIEQEITKRLSDGYVKYPVVAVSLVKSMSRKIFTYGQFNQRGAIAFEDNMTLLNALSLAGGISKDGLFGTLKVNRKKEGKAGYKEIVETNLNNGLIENRKTRDMHLKPDDILIIEHNETFLIQGDVAQRGRMVLEKDMTVLRALIQAGGVTKDGSYGRIKLRRKQKGAAGEYKDLVEAKLDNGVIENSEVEDMVLQPDDILIIERNETFLIQGDVAQRGRMVLEKDMTVLRALLQAGGVTENGLFGKIKVRRKQAGKSGEYKDLVEAKLNNGVIENSEVEDMVLQPDDILIIERNETFLIQGDVAQRGRMVLEKDMTVLRALLQAGGVTENGLFGKIKVRRKQRGEAGDYKDFVEAKLNNGVIENSEVEDTVLQPDDILIIEKSKTYFIYGEVSRLGEFVLQNEMTVFKAITIAGGLSKWGSEGNVRILRRNNKKKGFDILRVNIEKVIDGDAMSDVSLQPGDIIIISAGIL